MMRSIVFVTQNKHKLADAQKLLPEYHIEHIDYKTIEIQSFDLKEIITQKLTHAYKHVQKPCFVMDTALSFECLNGFPGPFIKWWVEVVGEEKTCQIAQHLNQHGCTWTTTLGYFDGTETQYLEETVRGTISREPQYGEGPNWDWDTIFIPDGDTRTFAQMTFEDKQSYAVTKKLLDRLHTLLQNTPLKTDERQAQIPN